MFNSASLFHLLLSGAILLTGAASAATVWSIDAAVATALEHSPDTQIARERIAGAQAMVAQTGSAWYPQLSLHGGYTETNSPMMAFGSILNQRAFNFGLDFNQPGRIDNLNATGTVAYNLYSGGRATAQRNAAHAGESAATHDLQAAQQSLAAEVVKAVLNVQKARKATLAVEAGVKAYEAAVAAARARYDAGQMLKADLLSLEVQLAQTREALIAVRQGAQLAQHAFYFVLGLDASNETAEFIENDPALTRLSLPQTLDYSTRPELLGLQERLKAAESMVIAARGGRKPTVNAFASYQYDQGWQTDRHGDSWLAGVAIDLNIFDGGATSGKIRQSSAEVNQVKAMMRKVTLGIGLEVQQARDTHTNALERLAVSAQSVAQAEESAALTRARFKSGAVLTAELIGVESRLIEARLRQTVAAADERAALVELRLALGLNPLN
ncbi:MAG: TolC family protein [Cephaloticoccus sp.]|nr:TolC family protein [Cephaloticoccus sp.]